MVYGELKGGSPKTVLCYNHYDVQPAEPFELWDSPPFEATQRDGKLFGRGVGDDKGHIVCRLGAIDALKAVLGEVPCSVKFLIEGEEEIGSGSMPAFIEQHADMLKSDGCLWEFGGVGYDGRPQIFLGMRGDFYVELRCKLLAHDAHSGLGGSLFPNAAWRLVWALNTFKDQNERILIPGWYDDVRGPTAKRHGAARASSLGRRAAQGQLRIEGLPQGRHRRRTTSPTGLRTDLHYRWFRFRLPGRRFQDGPSG